MHTTSQYGLVFWSRHSCFSGVPTRLFHPETLKGGVGGAVGGAFLEARPFAVGIAVAFRHWPVPLRSRICARRRLSGCFNTTFMRHSTRTEGGDERGTLTAGAPVKCIVLRFALDRRRWWCMLMHGFGFRHRVRRLGINLRCCPQNRRRWRGQPNNRDSATTR